MTLTPGRYSPTAPAMDLHLDAVSGLLTNRNLARVFACTYGTWFMVVSGSLHAGLEEVYRDFSWRLLRVAISITQSLLATQPVGGWWLDGILQQQQKLGRWDGFLMSGQWECGHRRAGWPKSNLLLLGMGLQWLLHWPLPFCWHVFYHCEWWFC